MKKLFFCFLCFSSLFWSQNQDVVVKDLPPKTEDTVFPLVAYTKNKRVANKINLFLQISRLEIIPESVKNPFYKIIEARTSSSGFANYYGWTRFDTPSSILSLELSGDLTGAYTENFDTPYNFDLRTGNLIDIKDVFTEEGLDFIVNYCNVVIRKEIEEEISLIDQEMAKNKEYSEYLPEQKEIYEECLEWFPQHRINWFQYSFGKNEITFIKGRCSNHALRALDDLGDFHIPIPYQELKPYLTPYGESLLDSTSKNVEVNNPNFRIYKGKLNGKYPIHLFVKEIYSDTSVSVVYWYDKYEKLIDLRGTYIDSHFSLIEDDYHYEEQRRWVPKAHIEMDLKGDSMTGIWTDYKTKKQYSIALEEL